jgi:hypothetical protein
VDSEASLAPHDSVATTIGSATNIAAPTRSYDDQVVIVKAGETLTQIVLHHLGRFSRQTIQQIQELNPGLTPDHIEIGQRIRLPGRAEEFVPLRAEKGARSVSTFVRE